MTLRGGYPYDSALASPERVLQSVFCSRPFKEIILRLSLFTSCFPPNNTI